MSIRPQRPAPATHRRPRGHPAGGRVQPREPAEPDRVLATVLFTDIVGSTQRSVEVGDRRWRDVLEDHHAVVRTELARFRGREIDTDPSGFRRRRCCRRLCDGTLLANRFGNNGNRLRDRTYGRSRATSRSLPY